MKHTILIILISVFGILSVSAHFDYQFYSPSQYWKPTKGFQFKELNLRIENDTINIMLLKTKSTSKATMFFYNGANGNILLNTRHVKILRKDKDQIYIFNFRGFGKFKLIKTKTKIIWKYVNLLHNVCKIF